MTHATHLVWTEAGKPDPRREVVNAGGACLWCGCAVHRGCKVADVIDPTTFNNWDKLAATEATHICIPCTWATTGRAPDTMRLWSVLCRDNAPASHERAPWHGSRLHLQNKADPSAFLATLLDPPNTPWVLSLAESGQIHTLPFARVNRGPSWCVRLERMDVHGTTPTFTALYRDIERLYAAGYSKEDIATGEPRRLHDMNLWRECDGRLRRYRQGALMTLALFLLRRRPDVRDGNRPGVGDDGLGQYGQDQAHRLVDSSTLGT